MSTPLFTSSGESTDVEKVPESQDNSNDTPSQSPDSDQHLETTKDEHAVRERTIRGLRWFLMCLGIFSSNTLYGLDTTIAADIQAAVSETYGNVSQVGWLGVGFGLGSTVFILPLGKMYAVFDTKWLFTLCLLMFAAASALCGAAPNMNALIVGRVWAGAGGAGMYLGTLNLITLTTGPKEQSIYVGIMGFIYGSGCILGPVVGGLLADSAATWRWAFYLNLVIFGVMSPIYIWAIPSLPQQPDVSFVDKLKKLDWLGMFLTAGMYVCFVVAFAFGGAIWAWSDGKFIALVVLTGLFVIAFAVTQHFAVFTTKMDRLFPCEFLRDPQLVLLYCAMAAGGAGLFVAVYYIPLYFLFIHGESGTMAAVRLLPFVAFYVTSMLACGYLMPRVGYHWLWYLISGLLLTGGGVGMYTIGVDTPASHTYGFSVLLGFGLTVSQAGYAIAPGLVKSDRVSEAIQFMNIAQGQSQLLGLAIASAIFQNEAFRGAQEVLGGEGYSKEQIQAAIAGSSSDVFKSVSAELRDKLLRVVVGAIQAEYIMVMTAGAVITVCALFLNKKRF